LQKLSSGKASIIEKNFAVKAKIFAFFELPIDKVGNRFYILKYKKPT